MDLHRANQQRLQILQVGDGATQVIEKPKKSRAKQFLERVEESGDSSYAADVIVSELREDSISTNTLRKALKEWAELREEEADQELEQSLCR